MIRREYDISDGWEWTARRPAPAWLSGRHATSERAVDLPHCWNRTDTFQPGVGYRRGPGGYRKMIHIPDQAGLHWFLESDGFYGIGELRIDGQRVCGIDGEYLGLAVDITRHVHPGGDHLVAIRLTNRCPRRVLPGIRMPDFLLYGGLAGRCYLRGKPPVRLVAAGTYVETEHLDDERCRLRVHYELAGGEAEVAVRIRSPDGAVTAEGRGCGPLICELARPQRWDVDAPRLYTAELALDQGDAISIRFGIREAEFRGVDGFFLNGRRLFLHGCNRHESIPGVGNALTPAMHRYDAQLLKEFGANFVRLSHYPQHPAFLDACDELGILVYAEIATWKSVRGGGWLENARRQLARMIRRDRNHPSVILWGLGNESRRRAPYLALTQVVRGLDRTRPTIYAENHLHRARRQGTLDIPDVYGVNYELQRLDEAGAVSRTGAVLVSECASWPTRRGDRAAEHGQLCHLQQAWDAIGDRSFVAGCAIWCFADYATLRKRRYTRYSGIVDAWRIPKPAAWLMKAAGAGPAFVKVIAAWGRAGSGRRPVLVFTNCGEVRLSGAVSLSLTGRRWHALELDFVDAPLRAESAADPAVVDTVLPWSPATALRLAPSHEWLTVYAIDDAGMVDGDFAGPVRLVSDRPEWLLCFRPGQTIDLAGGVGRVYLCPGSGRGRVRATAPGLLAAECEL